MILVIPARQVDRAPPYHFTAHSSDSDHRFRCDAEAMPAQRSWWSLSTVGCDNLVEKVVKLGIPGARAARVRAATTRSELDPSHRSFS